MRRLFAAAVATALSVTAIQGAEAQNYRLNPTFGTVNLNSGFLPDPYTTSLQAGGPIAASNVGSNCRGYVADAPDYRLYYQSGGFPLHIFAQSGSDTTLVINDPSGRWFCDDDGYGSLNPLVTFNNPASGQYDIWVGTYSSGGGFPQATLSISELSPHGGGGGGGGGTVAGSPNYNLQPTYGTVNLNNGFSPDPYNVSVQAGGNLAASSVGSNCRGYVAEAPDYRLYYQAGNGWPLNIFAQSGSDTTLVVNDPSGRWYCDDDSYGSLNPLVTFNSPQSGQYDIWVGTYSSGGGFPQATLSISELNQGGGSAGGGGGGGGGSANMPNWNLQPSYGSVNLNTGYTPDPYVVSVQAGGNIPASNVGGNCRGYVAQAPDYRLNYQAGNAYPLYLYAISSSDTTLVVNGPNGQWYCDDDGGNGLNPSLTFSRPQSGQYDIWVGTYSSGGGFPQANLYISEVQATQ